MKTTRELQGLSEALKGSVAEPHAFLAFYDQIAERLLAYFAKRTFDAEIALDLTAETLAQVWTSRHRYRGSSDEAAAAWTFAIAQRQLSRYIRRGAVNLKTMRRLSLERPDMNAEARAQVEDLAELHDVRGVLREELAKLPAGHRQAVWLRVVEERSYADVAARLGVSEPAARARVSRGLRALASYLDASPAYREL